MSGGVDSFVAAWLLEEQGYNAIGMAIQVWQDEDAGVQEVEGGYYGLDTVDGARRVATDLGISHYVMNFKEEFRKNVTDYSTDEYVEERAPNPYIAHNRHMKWESLLRWSIAIEADYIATGHYAQIDSLPGGHYFLKASVTAAKDQACALYSLTQEQLSHTLMPVGSYHKEEIRDMAERLGLPVAHKPDNQEICLIPDHDYAPLIEKYTGKELPPGNLMDLDDSVLGCYRGITYHTVGQRKGLNLSMDCPVLVMEIRPKTNEVVIGNNRDMFTSVLRCNKLDWMAVDGLHGEPMDVSAKIRYNRKGSPCTVREIGYDVVGCRFHEPVRVVTPGQVVVLYDGDYMTGGGTIIR